MAQASVLLVEDERIVAEDIRTRLERLGYSVCAISASGDDALRKAAETCPDIVLMDIVLQGALDGVETAALLRERFHLPVVYLTAYADSVTLQRAKLTEPLGYVLKPFEERQLVTALETALYKHTIEKRLQASERLLMTTLQSIGDAVITTDVGGCITRLNPIAEALTGWCQEEIIGADVTNVFRITQDNGEPLGEHPVMRALHEGRIVSPPQEMWLQSKDGMAVPIAKSAAPIRDEHETIVGAVVVFRDITAQKQLAAQVQQAQKLQAIGTLAGGIAHDFNNLLAAILGFTELSLDDVPRSSATWHNLQAVLTAGKRAKDLVQQMLTFSRQQAAEGQPLQLHLLIKEALALLRATLPTTIEIRQHLAQDAGTVLANPAQMHQVLMHLGSNAADAMRDTGGVLDVCLDVMEVDSVLATAQPELHPGSWLRLLVKDTGHGMPPEVQARIFEPFFTTKDVGAGTGMGLAVVHGIIMQHGGMITVDSLPGHGSTFTIYLPQHDAAVASTSQPSHALPASRGRILFVDDEPMVAEVSRALLARMGYDVVVSTDSQAALATFRMASQDFDLVITDQAMPRITGTALVRELRQVRPDIPVILCTGFSDALDTEKAVALGIDALLMKPTVARDWVSTIQQVFTHRKALAVESRMRTLSEA